MPEAYVKSAQRVLELLEFFAEWRRPASVKEIGQSLGYPQSSTSVLLKSLKDSGYFDHDARTGMYAPNIRLALATGWIEEQQYTDQSLLRLMEKLSAETGHTVMIGTREGAQVRYLHVLQGTRPQRVTVKTGSLHSLFLSAAGQALLGTLSEAETSRLLRSANARAADAAGRATQAQALELRRAAMARGYAVALGDPAPLAATVALLLPVPKVHMPLTVALGGPAAEIAPEQARLAAVLQDARDPFRQAALNALKRFPRGIAAGKG